MLWLSLGKNIFREVDRVGRRMNGDIEGEYWKDVGALGSIASTLAGSPQAVNRLFQEMIKDAEGDSKLAKWEMYLKALGLRQFTSEEPLVP
jgi:hypothetical protein